MAETKRTVQVKAANWKDYAIVGGVIVGAYTLCRVMEEQVVKPVAKNLFKKKKTEQITEAAETTQAV
jgi:hypothetical protein